MDENNGALSKAGVRMSRTLEIMMILSILGVMMQIGVIYGIITMDKMLPDLSEMRTSFSSASEISRGLSNVADDLSSDFRVFSSIAAAIPVVGADLSSRTAKISSEIDEISKKLKDLSHTIKAASDKLDTSSFSFLRPMIYVLILQNISLLLVFLLIAVMSREMRVVIMSENMEDGDREGNRGKSGSPGTSRTQKIGRSR